MDRLKMWGGSAAAGASAVVHVVPVWVVAFIAIVMLSGPELRNWVEMGDRIAWRWFRSKQSDEDGPPEDAQFDPGSSPE